LNPGGSGIPLVIFWSSGAAAAALLLRDSALRARMGQAGRERAERHFARARMLTEIAALYREAAGFPAEGSPTRGV